MVRMFYALKDEKIRSFADAFRLKVQCKLRLFSPATDGLMDEHRYPS